MVKDRESAFDAFVSIAGKNSIIVIRLNALIRSVRVSMATTIQTSSKQITKRTIRFGCVFSRLIWLGRCWWLSIGWRWKTVFVQLSANITVGDKFLDKKKIISKVLSDWHNSFVIKNKYLNVRQRHPSDVTLFDCFIRVHDNGNEETENDVDEQGNKTVQIKSTKQPDCGVSCVGSGKRCEHIVSV